MITNSVMNIVDMNYEDVESIESMVKRENLSECTIKFYGNDTSTEFKKISVYYDPELNTLSLFLTVE